MLTSIYSALLAIIGQPTVLPNSSSPVLAQFGGLIVYTVSALMCLMVVSFVFKFILKLVER